MAFKSITVRNVMFLFLILTPIFHLMGCDEEGDTGSTAECSECSNAACPVGAMGWSFTAMESTEGTDGIVSPVPSTGDFDTAVAAVFSKYTYLKAPNGSKIYFLAESLVSNEQLIRARRIMKHYLANVPNSTYGIDKTAVANALATNKAALFYFNDVNTYETQAENLNDTNFKWQDLRADESPIDGSKEWMAGSPRDASFEEILHLTQDYGIKTALPAFQTAIESVTNQHVALKQFTGWEGLETASYPQEYFALIYDVYIGQWPINKQNDDCTSAANCKVTNGSYPYSTHDAVKTNDASGYALITGFLPDHLAYTVRLSSDFSGTFYMYYKADTEYTWRSQYMKKVRLMGSNNSNIEGNSMNNQLRGNAGNNILNGEGGTDLAIFSGVRADYTITVVSPTEVTVKDNGSNQDGTDTLKNMEKIQFSDGRVVISTLTSP